MEKFRLKIELQPCIAAIHGQSSSGLLFKWNCECYFIHISFCFFGEFILIIIIIVNYQHVQAQRRSVQVKTRKSTRAFYFHIISSTFQKFSVEKMVTLFTLHLKTIWACVSVWVYCNELADKPPPRPRTETEFVQNSRCCCTCFEKRVHLSFHSISNAWNSECLSIPDSNSFCASVVVYMHLLFFIRRIATIWRESRWDENPMPFLDLCSWSRVSFLL